MQCIHYIFRWVYLCVYRTGTFPRTQEPFKEPCPCFWLHWAVVPAPQNVIAPCARPFQWSSNYRCVCFPCWISERLSTNLQNATSLHSIHEDCKQAQAVISYNSYNPWDFSPGWHPWLLLTASVQSCCGVVNFLSNWRCAACYMRLFIQQLIMAALVQSQAIHAIFKEKARDWHILFSRCIFDEQLVAFPVTSSQ